MSKSLSDTVAEAGCFMTLIAIAIICGIAVGVSALMGWAFMELWNFAVVEAFHAEPLSFYVAWGIWILISFVGGAFRSATKSKD